MTEVNNCSTKFQFAYVLSCSDHTDEGSIIFLASCFSRMRAYVVTDFVRPSALSGNVIVFGLYTFHFSSVFELSFCLYKYKPK